MRASRAKPRVTRITRIARMTSALSVRIREIRGLKDGASRLANPSVWVRVGPWFLFAALAGCSGKPAQAPAAAQAAALDCSLSFEALKAKVTGQPELVAAPKEPGEPYDWYNSADGATSYVVTEAGAPGHPAILMERAAGGQE